MVVAPETGSMQGLMSDSARSVTSALSSRPIAVRCRGVTKTYGKGGSAVRALRGVDLEVHQGEMMMLVGPSGCGKTTLISVVAGVLDRDEGECTVLGEDFKTQHASGKFGEGYEELTTGLEQAIEGISDMGEALRGMMQAIQSLDEQMAGS